MGATWQTILLSGIIYLSLLTGCQPDDFAGLTNTETQSESTQSVAQPEVEPVTITILNTADEHGWLQPVTPFRSDKTIGGAANVYSWWLEKEQLDPETFLILSGGDNWTGPSISTWFEGEPMTEVFNYMGYHASVIGNHEFDFGREVMGQRFAEADFPYLGANIRDKATGELADFTQPYLLTEVRGVMVGILGLATIDTPTTTHPKNISDLEFAPYDETVDRYLPEMKAKGAEIMIILSHVCLPDLITLARQTEGVHAMFAGHCNVLDARIVNGISVIGSGGKFASYARLDITYDRATGDVTDMVQTLVPVSYITADGNPVTPDPEITATIAEWQTRVDQQLNEPIGYLATELRQRSHPQANLVTDAWLWAYPSADIAVTNWGGFRAFLPAGDITWGTVVDVLPFDNNLTTVTITVRQLAENLLCCGGAVGGITYQIQGSTIDIKLMDGSDLDLDATYTVIINDFMYAGGDDYRFGAQDPQGYDTSIHWRQPVIDYILSLETSEAAPLNAQLDVTARLR
ncbi:MAG: bifunctional UDP-sugar hydrolase/5'-nucleotidase [Chloroflexota bacterium]